MGAELVLFKRIETRPSKFSTSARWSGRREGDRRRALDRFTPLSAALMRTCAAGSRSASGTASPQQALASDRLQIFARQPDVQPAVLAERGLRIAGVPGRLALAAFGGLPPAARAGGGARPFVRVPLHSP